jgi:hypothetical protein
MMPHLQKEKNQANGATSIGSIAAVGDAPFQAKRPSEGLGRFGVWQTLNSF